MKKGYVPASRADRRNDARENKLIWQPLNHDQKTAKGLNVHRYEGITKRKYTGGMKRD